MKPAESPLPVSPEDGALLTSLNQNQREQLELYVEKLLTANRSFNLTAVRDKNDAWQRHVVESLRLLPFVASPRRMLDVGSGGGLPGLILAIARPDIEVCLLEATGKKAHFLESTGEALGLKNLRVICARAEEAASKGSELRETFELVTARAVAPLRTLLELTIPFLTVGGTLLSVKGERADDEIKEATNAFRLLSCEVSETHRQPSATLVLIKKTRRCSLKYPRRSGEPKHRPL